ncbi:hypothetical protein C0J52_10651 [Blattella germanica]|nr:hypothetical protein C0J52_10651 [Blattella germanica]
MSARNKTSLEKKSCKDQIGWRIRKNSELRKLFGQPDIVVKIKQERIRWAGHVQRISETGTAKKVFIGKLEGRRRRGRPRKRWIDDVEEDLRKMGVTVDAGEEKPRTGMDGEGGQEPAWTVVSE